MLGSALKHFSKIIIFSISNFILLQKKYIKLAFICNLK